MRGKNKCKILKEIRQKIADENDIPYVTRECTYQGDCSGTCPRCEAELRYLEQELEKRKRLGKGVAVAAIAASLALNTGCVPSGKLVEPENQLEGDVPYVEETTEGMVANDDPTEELPSENPETECPERTEGEVAETELEGDVAPAEETDLPDEPLMGRYIIEEPPIDDELPVETMPEAPEGADSRTDAG